MSKQWKSCPGHKGVEYAEHTTRKDDSNRKLDRYYRIRFTSGTKTVTSGLGWATEGFNEKIASEYRAMFIQNNLSGNGPKTFKEYKQFRIDEENEEKLLALENQKYLLTCAQLFDTYYFKYSSVKPNTKRTEIGIFNTWIRGAIGNLTLSEIKYDHLQQIKNNLESSKKSPRLTKYTLDVVRHLFNIAIKHGLYKGENLLGKNSIFRAPKVNNGKDRFLSDEEARNLLDELKQKSFVTYMQCSIALQTGMRKTEILALKWECLDFSNGLINIRDTKNNGKTRSIPMTSHVRKLLVEKKESSKSVYVFGNNDNRCPNDISKTFNRTVKFLGLNNNIVDARSKVTFHTLRHTYASWAISNGMTLVQLKVLLGHESILTTMRYAHLSQKEINDTKSIFENLPN